MLLTFLVAIKKLHDGPSSPPGIPIVELGESQQTTPEHEKSR